MIKNILKLLALCVLIWLVGLLLFMGQIFMQGPYQPDSTSDAIVVLTGGTDRIEHALGLFAKGKAAHLFISGVHPDVSMRDITNKWSGDVALPPCCITLGYEATTTQQNAKEVHEWIMHEGYSSIRLVTSNFHMNRSMIELRHVMPDIEIIPHPIIQSNARAADLWFWIVSFKEYNKIIVRWATLILMPGNAHTEHSEP